MKKPSLPDAHELPTAFATLCAADVMQQKLITVQAGDPLSEVERVLADARISGVPVLDDNGHVLGVLSMRDLVSRYAEDHELPERADEGGLDEDLDDTEPVAFQRAPGGGLCAGDLMNTDIASVPPTASLRQVARCMVERQVHRLLVVERGRILGLVSTMDVLRALAG